MTTEQKIQALRADFLKRNGENHISTERIEMLTGQERPGLANVLGCVKYYYFDRHSTRIQASSAGAFRKARQQHPVHDPLPEGHGRGRPQGVSRNPI